ncbi:MULTISPECIES: NADP-dependent oxidoreductase [unclassified Parafrankia]|uniref:NADP-dependent oxidoreductase n=1 Tax=unclassified Parafrankia TaxID=2994368 RepID=UPI000DA475A2|nr:MULTISPECIES: NADP-dependent oxidoreductase [unclassified Parafrankia]TCJ35347.1 NADP-dependent oxidoreductase [Parafrankia sp. BMG5.11]SQD99826.1 Alcohol dehydrogenase zinc-binding domain protein [Parafrankia sp. Ea1.12]
MKAAAFARHGGPEVLELMDLATPVAGPGQVRVRVRFAGVQPIDCAVRAGWAPPGVTPRLPTIPGNEFAGVVDQVGDEVDGVGGIDGVDGGGHGVAVGAEVLGFGQLGAYAEYLVVPAGQVTAKPAGMSWEVAGGFSGGAQTAHIALRELGVGRDDTVLIHAAAGGVGTVAVQLAVRAGSTVIGTAGAANHDYLRSLGAIPVAYGDGLVERVQAIAPAGVDAVLDGAGGDALTTSLALVADRSRILTLVEHGRAGELGIRVTPNLRSAARLAELADLQAHGALHINVRRVVPLADAAEAHRELETRHGRGKIVLAVSSG